MRVFLRSSQTGRYYGHTSRVDAEAGTAMEFPNVRAATEHALSAKLVEVKVALLCDYLSEEILLPVVPEWADANEDPKPQTSLLTPTAAAA